MNNQENEKLLINRIIDLILQGMNDRDILKQLKTEKIEISIDTFTYIYNNIKLQNVNKDSSSIKNHKELDDMILDLKLQGLFYEDIEEELQKNGIDITSDFLVNRCIRICREKGIRVPIEDKKLTTILGDKIKLRPKIIRTILELGEIGVPFSEIAVRLQENYGVQKINPCIIKNIYDKYSDKTRKGNFKRSRINHQHEKSPHDDRIRELIKNGMEDKQIIIQLQLEGILTSESELKKRCYCLRKEQENNKRTKIFLSKLSDTALLKIFKKIQINKRASDEQLKKLAEHYGIEYKRLSNDNRCR